jgi:hypothetical protein
MLTFIPRLINVPVTHGKVSSARPHSRSSMHFLILKMNMNRMKCARTLPEMPLKTLRFFTMIPRLQNERYASLHFIWNLHNHATFQHWTGLFRGTLIVKTFSAHFTAIRGLVTVRSLGDPKSRDTAAYGALAISVAAVRSPITT